MSRIARDRTREFTSTTSDRRGWVVEFRDFWDFIDASEHDDPGTRNRGGRSSRDKGSSWSGSGSFAESIRMARLGWPEGRSKIMDFSSEVQDIAAQAVPMVTTQYDVFGSYVDVGRYVDGLPENMVDFTMAEVDKLITVVVCLSASAVVGTREMENRGAAVVGMTEALMQMGYNVQLVATFDIREGYKHITFSVPLKTFSEVLDIDKVAFALINPSFFRRIGFSVFECTEDEIIEQFEFEPNGGYGHPDDYTTVEGDVVLNSESGSLRQFDTKESSTQWVVEQLRRFIKK